MARDNKFFACTMDATIVSPYYPNNPDFDHFTFQPMIADGNAAADDYVLVVYAVGPFGEVLGPPGGYVLPKLKGGNSGLKANPQVQFANMHVNQDMLGALYPGAGHPITPAALVLKPLNYAGTNYVCYEIDNPDSIMTTSVTMNPSPPAP